MKYDYQCVDTGLIYEVNHSIKDDAFKTMKQVIECSGGIENLVLSNEYEQEVPENIEIDENSAVTRVISGGVGVVYKGLGWPSMDSKHLKYTGKRKKQMEKLREDRAKRVSSGMSISDIASGIGVDGIKDTVVNNKTWDGMSGEQKNVARSYGLRPSKEFTK